MMPGAIPDLENVGGSVTLTSTLEYLVGRRLADDDGWLGNYFILTYRVGVIQAARRCRTW